MSQRIMSRVPVFSLWLPLLLLISVKNTDASNMEEQSVVALSATSEQLAFNQLVTEADYLNEIPVILSATRMSQPVNSAPASITVISKEMIDASGAQEIGDLLRLVPGFQVGYFSGTSMSLAYHGFTGNYDRRLEVLIDGRSAYMPFLSTVEWLSLPLDISEIEKIEVVRSSNAPVYGANAMQGVINIITRKVFEDEGFMVEGRWGTYDVTGTDRDIKNRDWRKLKNRIVDKKYLLRYASSIEKMDYRVTLGYQEDTGFKNVSDSKQLNLFHVNTQYQLNTRDTVDAHVGARIGNMDTFADGVPEDPYRNKSVSSQYQSLTWTRALQNGEEVKVQFYHNYYNQNDEVRITNSAFPFPYDFGVYYGVAERFDLEVEKVSNLLPNLRLMLGSGVRLDRIESKHLLGKTGFINDRSMRIFGNAEWYITDKIVFNGGLMMEHNDQIGRYLLPRLAVNFLATEAHTFRASVTKSTRTPSILENNVNVGVRMDDGTQVYTYHVSARNLRPERQYSAELGYLFAPRGYNLRFDTKFFVEYIRDGILEAADYSSPERPWLWGNNTRADIQGIESQLYYKPHRRVLLNLSHSRANLVGVWNKSVNKTEGAPKVRDLSNTIPKDTFSGLFSFALTPETNWSFVYYYMSDMAWLQDGNAIEAYDRLDTNIDWNHKISSQSLLNLALTLQNIKGQYLEVQNENVFKQRVFLKIRYEW